MEIIKCDMCSMYVDLGKEFNNIVIKADFERTNGGSCVFTRTMVQVKPVEKVLSNEEKKDIVKAILEWNSHLKTISFV